MQTQDVLLKIVYFPWEFFCIVSGFRMQTQDFLLKIVYFPWEFFCFQSVIRMQECKDETLAEFL